MTYHVIGATSTSTRSHPWSAASPAPDRGGDDGARSEVPLRCPVLERVVGVRMARPRPARWRTSGTRRCSSPDHFIDTPLAPMVAIAMAAEATTTLRVGHLVLGNDYKHPAVVAKEAATIDLLSDGRHRARDRRGVDDRRLRGARHPATTARAFASHGSRRRSRSSRGASRGEAFDFSGEHYTIKGYAAEPKPVQQPHPPIVDRRRGAEGAAPRRPRGRHRRHQPEPAQGRGDAPTRSRARSPARRWRRSGGFARARATGSTTSSSRSGTSSARSPTTPSASPRCVGGAYDIKPEDTLASGVALVGPVDQCIETLQQRREEWQVSYIVFGEDNFEQFAPVVAALAGT